MKSLTALLLLAVFLCLTGCRPSPEKLLATANKYHQNKQYKEADILYQKIIAKDKTNAEAYYRGGLNLIDEGQAGAATRYLRRAVDLKPSNVEAVSKLAEIYLTAYMSNPSRLKNLLPEVVDLKGKLLQRDPNSFEGLRLQGLIAAVNHQQDEALQSFAKANQVKPYSPELAGWYAQALMSANRQDEAEKLVRETVDHNKSWGGGYMFLYALAGKNSDRPKQEAILRERLQNEPKDAAGHVALATFLLQTDRYPDAETVMKGVLADKQSFPAGHELMGDFYAAAKKYDQAIDQYQAGAKEDAKNTLHYQQRIVATYLHEGQRAKGLDLARSLAKDNPKDNTSNEMYASLLLDTGLRADAAKSISELKSLVVKDPANSVLHLDLSRAYLITNRLDEALGESKEALQQEAKSHNPRTAVLLPGRLILARVYEAKGQHAQALEQTQQVLQAEPQNAEARLLHDESLVGVGEADQARPDLEKLVAQIPAENHSGEANQARLLLGELYARSNDNAKAEALFESVWKATPPDYRGFAALQQLNLKEGKADLAVSSMQDLVNKNPSALNLRFDLANLQSTSAAMLIRTNPDKAKGLLETAAGNYKQILKTTANSSLVWSRLGLIQSQLGQLEPALASFEQAVNADPKNIGALVARAELLDGAGRKQEATDGYNHVLGVDPNNTVALNNLAFLNAQGKTNLVQAQSFAERAKKQAPNSPDISDTLGYVYYQRDLNNQALQIFRQNVQDHPDNPTFHFHLAMALLRQGDKQGARLEATKAQKNAAPQQQQQIQSFVGQIG